MPWLKILTNLILANAHFSNLLFYFWPISHLQQVTQVGALFCIIHYVQGIAFWIGRDPKKPEGILCYSTWATPPVSVNVVEWVRGAVLINKRAEVTLLSLSSGLLTLSANRVTACYWHANYLRLTIFMSGLRSRYYDIQTSSCSHAFLSKWLLSASLLCSPKSYKINGVIKCRSRILRPFGLTWCNSH